MKLWTPKKPALITRRRALTLLGGGLASLGLARPARARLMLNQLSGFGDGGVVEPPTISFRTNAKATTNAASHSLPSVDVGASAASHHVLVGVGIRGGGARSTDTLSVGGSPATLVRRQANTNNEASLWIVGGIAATTAQIDATYNNTVENAGFMVWEVHNLLSDVALDSAGDATDPLNLDIDVVENGIAVGIAFNRDGGSAVTWTGLTERVDDVTEVGTGSNFSCADLTTSALEAPRTVTADVTGSVATPCGVAASFA